MKNYIKILFLILIFSSSLILKAQAPLCIEPVASYSLPSFFPTAIAQAYIDVDIQLDFVTANTNSNVTVQLGDGVGNFSISRNKAVGLNPKFIEVGDFNNDGSLDIITASNSATFVSVLFSYSPDSFPDPPVFYPIFSNCTALTLKDIDEDALPEIIAGSSSGQVSIFSHTSAAAPLSLTYTLTGAIRAITPYYGSNYNLAIVHGGSTFSLTILIYDGVGSFTTGVSYSLGAHSATTIAAIIAGDFNKDSSVDLAVSLSDINSVLLYTNNGIGIFSTPTSFGVDSNPFSITTDDFNGDTYPDIATANNVGTASILLNDGSGSFKPAENYPTGFNPTSIVAGDFNNDSKADLVIANSGSTFVSGLMTGLSPTITVNGGKVCIGNNFVINPTGAVTYSYSSGSQTVSPTTLTSYSVTGTAANGCVSATEIINVIVDPLPNISISASSTSLCPSSSATLTASGGNSYTWSTGSASDTAHIAPNVTTNYLVSGTNPDGCVGNESITITVQPFPAITVNSGTICAGKTFTIIPNGASSYTWSNGANATSIVVSPTVTSSYSVTGESSLGCVSSNMAISSVSVNTLPTLTIASSSASLCAFTNATLTASGANTYIWSTGSNSITTIITPSVTSSYSVMGTNALGCSNTQTISLLVANSTNISGNVTTGASIPVSGFVTLYRYEPMFTKFDSVSTINISGTGAFTFTNAINSNTYIIKATPTSNTLLVTYGNSSVAWMSATQFVHGCANASTANVNVISLTPVVAGVGSLSGLIEKGPGYGQRSSDSRPLGTPIKGIIVKGGRNPGGNIVAQTTTDANGTYTLSGLPTNSDNYFILVDMPGLDTNGTYRKILTAGNTSFNNLNFTVDSAKINPTNVTVGINELTLIENNISVFPNPTSSNVSVNFTLLKNSAVKIEMFDILGKQVKTLIDSKTISANSYNTTATITDLDAGIYFIRIAINNKEQIIKLCVQR